MNTRFAGSDHDLHALIASSLAQLGLGATGLYGTADLFLGDTNGLNSGEIPLNMLIGLLPSLATTGGALGGASSVSGMHEARLSEASAQQELLNLKRHGFYGDSRGPRSSVDEDAINLHQLKANAARQELEELEQKMQRRGGYGALAGAIAGGIPAIMMMQDHPAAQGSGASKEVQQPAQGR